MLAMKDTTALHVAAAVGSVKIVEYLLEKQHADLHARTSVGGGVAALMYAAATVRPKIVEMVIAHGAPVDEAIEDSTDPVQNKIAFMYIAVFYGNMDVLTVLLDHGADINTKTVNGTSVL